MAKRCLVTGANGHLGNNLVRLLLRKGYSVRASVRNMEYTEPFKGLDCKVVYADLLDKESLLRAMEGIDILFQAAAVFKHWSRNNKKEIINPNIEGTRNVIEAAAEKNVKKIVYVSSIAALNHFSAPLNETTWNHYEDNPYYYAKTQSEKLAWDLAKKYNLSMVSVLPSSIIGPNSFGHLTPSMKALSDVLKNKLPFNPNFHFNYVDVNDLTKGIISAAEKGRDNERYVLATEEQITSSQIFDIAKTLFPRTKKPPEAPKSLLYMIALITGLFGKITGISPPMMRSWLKLYYKADLRCDITKAKKELGYNPRAPEDVLKDAFIYLAKHHSA